MESADTEVPRQELSAEEELVTSVKVRGAHARFEVRIINALYQARLVHITN